LNLVYFGLLVSNFVLKVDSELAALEKLNEAESKPDEADDVTKKRADAGLKVHLLRKRSLEAIQEQVKLRKSRKSALSDIFIKAKNLYHKE